MPQFTDKNGKEWTIELTVRAIKRVERRMGFNLAKIDHPVNKDSETPLFTDLVINRVLVSNAVFAILAAKVSDEEYAAALDAFDESLDGRALNDLVAAFWSALEDFFRHGRPDLVAAIKEQKQVMEKTIETAARKTPGNSASASPESSASTPPTSPSANSA